MTVRSLPDDKTRQLISVVFSAQGKQCVRSMASNGGFEPMATEYASVDESGDDAGDRRAQNASLLHFDPKTVGDEMVNTGVGGEDGKPKLAGSYVGGTIKPSVAELINDPDVDVSQLAGHVAELFDK